MGITENSCKYGAQHNRVRRNAKRFFRSMGWELAPGVLQPSATE
jgi:hypothetical protein